jgi:AP-4 complex subunit epsilon-1
MEYLIILLYCFNAIEVGFSPGSIAFALPHAVNLAEAGKTIEQKRIGKFIVVKTLNL